MDGFFLNNTPASDYGLVFLDNCYEELRSPAKPKGVFINNWQDEHGTERDLSGRYLDSRTLVLPVLIEGDGETDFSLKHQDFIAFILTAGYFTLKVERLGRNFTLIYEDITDYKDYYDHCTFNLVLVDDFPHVVTVIAPPVNLPPTAIGDAYTVLEGGTLNITATAAGLLANDADPEGEVLTAELVALPINGTLSLNSNGTFVYVHNGSETTSDSFTYKINDGTIDGNVATVNITVTPVADPAPVPVSMYPADNAEMNIETGNYNLEMTFGTDMVRGTSGVAVVKDITTGQDVFYRSIASGDIYIDNSRVCGLYNVPLVKGHKYWVYISPGLFKDAGGTPHAGFENSTGWNFSVKAATNYAPVATGDAYTVATGGTLNIAAAQGVLVNDTDPEGNPLTVTMVAAPVNATVTLNPDGSFTYVHNGSPGTADSFTYKVNDGTQDGNIATVNITVTPVQTAAPVITQFVPADNAETTVTSAYSELRFQFNKNVVKGAGNIRVKNTTDNAYLEDIAVYYGSVKVYGNVVVIESVPLQPGKAYAITMPAGAFKDESGNNFAGILDDTTWNITTAPAETVAPPPNPVAITLFPSDDSVTVAASGNIAPYLIFNKPIFKGISGFVKIKRLEDGVIVWERDVSHPDIYSANVDTVNLSAVSILTDKKYAVEIAPGTFKDADGNDYAGITNDTAWNFEYVSSAQPVTPTPPVATAYSPANNTTVFDQDGFIDLTLTFDENIIKGAGSLIIRDITDTQNVIVTFRDVALASVEVLNNTATIKNVPLTAGRRYAIQIPSGVFKDTAGTNYAGILYDNIWSFTASATQTISGIITPDDSRSYHLNNAQRSTFQLTDNILNENVFLGNGTVLPRWETWYEFPKGTTTTVSKIRLYDWQGGFADNPMKIYAVAPDWTRTQICNFTGSQYEAWVDGFVGNVAAKYLIIEQGGSMATEWEVHGTQAPIAGYVAPPVVPMPTSGTAFKNMLGVNAYNWNFSYENNETDLNPAKLAMIKPFREIRNYLDWGSFENPEGSFTYNPIHAGGWMLDKILKHLSDEGIDTLLCVKSVPGWLNETKLPADRHGEAVPARGGANLELPESYRDQAEMLWQITARQGSNQNINPALIKVNTNKRWGTDLPNEVKIGLGTLKYIELDNERDKWWQGRKAYQTGREYGANSSASYDGHKNTMGEGVGIKNADPTMQVVMMGVALARPDYVRGMIDWCKEFRGYKPDGSVNLCWDVINYHLYANDGGSVQFAGFKGIAPELATSTIVQDFRDMCNEYANGYMPIWLTELGYDIHPDSQQGVPLVGSKTRLQVQGDWILRSSLLAARQRIDKVHFFQLYDDDPSGQSGENYATSGLVNTNLTRRPAADYILQAGNLIGDYVYKSSISADPLVDVYQKADKKMFVLTIPDQIDRKANYELDLGTATQAKIYRLVAGSDFMAIETVPTVNGKVTLEVTETPIFVEGGFA